MNTADERQVGADEGAKGKRKQRNIDWKKYGAKKKKAKLEKKIANFLAK